KESDLDLIVAGTQDAVLMVESEAKELTEEIMLGAVMHGHKNFQPVIEAIIRLAERAAKEPREMEVADNSALEQQIRDIAEKDLRDAYKIQTKQDRYNRVGEIRAAVVAKLCPEGAENAPSATLVGSVFHELEAKIVRWNILDDGIRIDGRDVKTVRPILS